MDELCSELVNGYTEGDLSVCKGWPVDWRSMNK